MSKSFGLREQIKNAQSEKEVTELLLRGRTYEWASEFTKRSWKSTAKFRLAELNNSVPAQTPDKPIESKKVTKKKKK
jgi:hypothetical protein